MRFIEHKLINKIFFWTGIPHLLAVIFIAWFFISSLSTEIKTLKNDAIFSSVQAHSDELANWLNGYRLYLKALSTQVNGKSSKKIANIIINHDFKDSNVEYIFYINSKKQVFYTNAQAPLIYNERFYKKLENSDVKLFLSAAEKSPFSDNMVISVFYKLENGEYLGMGLKLQVLQDIITSMKFGTGSFAFITDDSGLMTAIELTKLIFKLNVHNGDETLGYTGMNKIAEDFYATYTPTTGVYIRPKTNESLRSFMIPIPKTNGWSMGFVYPVENYLFEIKEINMQFMVLIFGLVLLLLIILAIVLHSAFSPIKQMIKIFTNLASKSDNSADLTARVKVINQDEIGELGEKFNSFMILISQLIVAIKDKYKILHENIAESNTNLSNISGYLEEQIDEISVLARGMDEFSATVQDIARISAKSAQITFDSKKEIQSNCATIDNLLNFMKDNEEQIKELQEIQKLRNSNLEELPNKVQAAHNALKTSLNIIDNLESLNIQIASATEQQSQNALEINKNIAKVLTFSGLVVENTKKVTLLQTSTKKAAQDLESLISRFKSHY